MARTTAQAPHPTGATINQGWLIFAELLADCFGPRPDRPQAAIRGLRGWLAGYRQRRAARRDRPRPPWHEGPDMGRGRGGLSSSPLSQDARTRCELLGLGHR